MLLTLYLEVLHDTNPSQSQQHNEDHFYSKRVSTTEHCSQFHIIQWNAPDFLDFISEKKTK